MVKDASHEVTGDRRQPAGVTLIPEQVCRAVLVPQAHVIMGATAGQMVERLGEERRHHPVLLGDRLHHPAEERVPVGRRQRIGVTPVDLELAVGILVIVGVGVPAQLLHVPDQRRHQIEVAVQGDEVVTGLLEDVEGIAGHVLAIVGLAQQNELRLDADLEGVPLRPGPLQLSPQDRARTVVERLALDLDVAGDPGHVGAPGHGRQRVEVGDVQHVGIVRPLPHVAGRETGEAGPLRGHVIEMGGRHEFGLGRTVHGHEGAQKELDAALGYYSFHFL